MRKADNLPLSCAVVTKSGNLNVLQPSGPVTGLLYLFFLLDLHEHSDTGTAVPPVTALLTIDLPTVTFVHSCNS